MKKSFTLVSSLVIVSFVLGCAAAALAQEGRPQIRTGAYRKIDKDNEKDAKVMEEAVAAAEFAITKQGEKEETEIKLVSVESAEVQTVAGAKYRLCLKVEVAGKGDEADVSQDVKVEVYKNLQRQYTLSSWKEAECGDDD